MSAPAETMRRLIGARRSIYVPQCATLAEAARICADHFLLFEPKDWPELHAMARAQGFGLVPGRRRASE